MQLVWIPLKGCSPEWQGIEKAEEEAEEKMEGIGKISA